MKKSKFLVRGMLGVIFFVPALRSSLLLYSKGFALLTFNNGVEIAAVEGGAASIDGHAVPKGQEWSCRDPGTGGGVLESRRYARISKNRLFDENHSVFCSKSVFLAGLFPGKSVFIRVLGTKSDRHNNFFPT